MFHTKLVKVLFSELLLLNHSLIQILSENPICSDLNTIIDPAQSQDNTLNYYMIWRLFIKHQEDLRHLQRLALAHEYVALSFLPFRSYIVTFLNP